MKKQFLVFSLILLSACSMGGSNDVTYAHGSIPCPAAVAMPDNVAQGFGQYASDPLMMNFYKHYLQQQRELAAFAQHNPAVPNCPTAFWVENGVADQFHQLPEGHPMREFFKTYAAQQRALDAYYTPHP